MEISLLPVDVSRWDLARGGELFVVPVWTDVRPLRGAAGLLDWRLNGWLSQCLREERFQGTAGEKLLVPTRRIPWRAILAIGAGASGSFDEERCRVWLATLFSAAVGLGFRTAAVALPGREQERIPVDRTVAMLREVMRQRPDPLDMLTLIDTPAALKSIAEALGLARTMAAPATTTPVPRAARSVQAAARSSGATAGTAPPPAKPSRPR
jgi:hypothetical protein